MTLLGHLQELRSRIISSLIAIAAGSIVAFLLFDPIIELLYTPFTGIDSSRPETTLFINTIFEGFVTKIKISILAGIVISFPVHLYNGIRFVFPGLTGKEKRVVAIGLAASFILIVGGFYYSFYNVIPLSVTFLTGQEFIPGEVGILLNYNKNIFYVLQFIFITLVVFQTPVILEILLIMGVLDRKTLLKASRYVIVGVFILSALITPPDFISQVSISIPLIGLFYLSLLIARIFHFGDAP